jgi:histidinol-phosphatase
MAASPSSFSLEDDLALAHELADLATKIAVPFFEWGVETIIKEDESPVSEADLEVDRRLVDVLQRERPDDAILSEESGEHGSSNRRWILDPIDGTFNFVEQRPAWGTHVALEVEGEVVLGVITRPMYQQRWYATRGGGAFKIDSSENGSGEPEPVHVSTTKTLAQSRICLWSHQSEKRLEELGRAFTVVRPSSLDNTLEVISGDLDALIDNGGHVWDHAPGVILVLEAGGSFRDPEGGHRLDLGQSTYSNGLIDDELQRFLAS